MIIFQDEKDIDRYIEKKLGDKKNGGIGLIFKKDFNDQRNVSDFLKDALKGSSKTVQRKGMGVPDFCIEKYNIPVIIENKKGIKFLQKTISSKLSYTINDIQNYAVNGAVYYARNIIASKKYDSAIAIGIAGDNDENLKMLVYYVFGSESEPKLLENYTCLDFLGNEKAFDDFSKNAVLTDAEKHRILIKTREDLLKYSRQLNKLMHEHSITAAERVLYVSGMLLAMQDVIDTDGNMILQGLIPENLVNEYDGIKIFKQIDKFLTEKNTPEIKKNIMLDCFKVIKTDIERDVPIELSKLVSKQIRKPASINRQIFQYIYDNIYTQIDGIAGRADIIGEMYSIFLKYALGDGKDLGIVITPPYITELMARLVDISVDSRVMDITTGSAGFLISCMEIMIEEVNKKYGKNTDAARNKIIEIKQDRLMGVEKDYVMYTLAATNMIMRGDGSAKIEKNDAFTLDEQLYTDFNANVLLLNPPFSYSENGMPFFKFGLEKLSKNGRAAIIVQDTAGAGKAVNSNKAILKKNRLIASIKMPDDLFMPYADVQTSIYVVEAGVPHNYDTDIVKFIDFRNDGYRRIRRGSGVAIVDNPANRYADLPIILKMGKSAVLNSEFHKDLWDFDAIYIEDLISNSGLDWNFESHKKNNIELQKDDFQNVALEYLMFETNRLIKRGYTDNKKIGKNANKLTDDDNAILSKNIICGEFTVDSLFTISNPKKKFIAKNLDFNGKFPYVVRSGKNNGIRGYIDEDIRYLNDANTISFGQDTATVFFQNAPYFAGDKIKIFALRDRNLTQNIALYLLTMLRKAFLNFAWGSSFDEKLLKQITIILPKNTDNTLDFDYMERYMCAIQKTCIVNLARNYELIISTMNNIIKLE